MLRFFYTNFAHQLLWQNRPNENSFHRDRAPRRTKLGLPDARYNSHTHEYGEVSSVVTVYLPLEAEEKLLQQFKLGGAPAVNSEEAEDSAAKEGIRHIERSQDVELEDLNHGELTCLMKQFKSLLYKKFKERREREDLQKELALSGKRMLKFSHHMSSLVYGNYSVGQGKEAESYNESLEQFEKIATKLSKDAKEITSKLKKSRAVTLTSASALVSLLKFNVSMYVAKILRFNSMFCIVCLFC